MLEEIAKVLEFRLKNPIPGEELFKGPLLLQVHQGSESETLLLTAKKLTLGKVFSSKSKMVIQLEDLQNLIDGHSALSSLLICGKIQVEGNMQAVREFSSLV